MIHKLQREHWRFLPKVLVTSPEQYVPIFLSTIDFSTDISARGMLGWDSVHYPRADWMNGINSSVTLEEVQAHYNTLLTDIPEYYHYPIQASVRSGSVMHSPSNVLLAFKGMIGPIHQVDSLILPYSVVGKSGASSTPIGDQLYYRSRTMTYCDSLLSSLTPQIMLTVQAKYIPILKLCTALEVATPELPESAFKLYRLDKGISISSAVDLLRDSGLQIKIVEGNLNTEYKDINFMRGLIMSDSPPVATGDFLNIAKKALRIRKRELTLEPIYA